MKKHKLEPPPLKLAKETVRTLDTDSLKSVVGGRSTTCTGIYI